MKTFKLEIVTPDGVTYSDDVESCVLPGSEGLFGVLPGHAPMVSSLGTGVAKFTKAGKDEYLALSGGFAQVEGSKVAVLAETAELAQAIDVERAKARAEAKGNEIKETKMSTDQARAAELSLLKELTRLKAADKGRGR
jgi:F-type H+-transporting ATPase subunit epsilon